MYDRKKTNERKKKDCENNAEKNTHTAIVYFIWNSVIGCVLLNMNYICVPGSSCLFFVCYFSFGCWCCCCCYCCCWCGFFFSLYFRVFHETRFCVLSKYVHFDLDGGNECIFSLCSQPSSQPAKPSTNGWLCGCSLVWALYSCAHNWNLWYAFIVSFYSFSSLVCSLLLGFKFIVGISYIAI